MTTPLCIGFIPLCDAAALIVAIDKGFARDEGLDVTLVREVFTEEEAAIAFGEIAVGVAIGGVDSG